MNEPVTCALPGCDQPIVELPGGPPRRYCGPAHRAAAGKLAAQEAMQDGFAGAPRGPAIPAGLDAARARHWRPAEHKPATAAAAALALATAAVPAVTLTGHGAHHSAGHPAAVTSQHAPAAGGTPAELLTKSESWSQKAQHSILQIEAQLSMLQQAEQRLESVPATQRTPGMNTLLRRVQRQMTKLGGELKTLTDEMGVWTSFQQVTTQLAWVNNEIGYLHGTAKGPGRDQGPTRLATSLSADEHTLSGQIGTWTAKLKHTIAQPVAAAPATPVTHLLSQVRGVIAPVATLVAAPAWAPAPPVQQPEATLPAAATPPATAIEPAAAQPPAPQPAAAQPAAAQPVAAQRPPAPAPVEQRAPAPAPVEQRAPAPSPVTAEPAPPEPHPVTARLTPPLRARTATPPSPAATVTKIVSQAESLARDLTGSPSHLLRDLPGSLAKFVQSLSENAQGS
jgi:hypothetical protein